MRGSRAVRKTKGDSRTITATGGAMRTGEKTDARRRGNYPTPLFVGEGGGSEARSACSRRRRMRACAFRTQANERPSSSSSTDGKRTRAAVATTVRAYGVAAAAATLSAAGTIVFVSMLYGGVNHDKTDARTHTTCHSSSSSSSSMVAPDCHEIYCFPSLSRLRRPESRIPFSFAVPIAQRPGGPSRLVWSALYLRRFFFFFFSIYVQSPRGNYSFIKSTGQFFFDHILQTIS